MTTFTLQDSPAFDLHLPALKVCCYIQILNNLRTLHPLKISIIPSFPIHFKNSAQGRYKFQTVSRGNTIHLYAVQSRHGYLLPQISFTLLTVALGFLPPATVSTVLASPLLQCIKAILLADSALITLEVDWTSSFSLLLFLFCRYDAEGWFCLTLPCPDN